MHLCDDDESSTVVQNRDGEYFVITEQSDCEQVGHDSQFRSPANERARWSDLGAYGGKGQPYKTVVLGMLAVALVSFALFR